MSRPEERIAIRNVRKLTEHVPGRRRITKYTSRDVAEGIVGGIVFSLPLLVEDGVFEIAEWFTQVTVGAIPLFLTLNILFIICLVAGLLYYTDFRDVRPKLLFGVIPRRLVALLLISISVAFSTMLLWGSLHEGDPSTLDAFARGTVIWAAAALGATLGDLLPGESRGKDLRDIIERSSTTLPDPSDGK